MSRQQFKLGDIVEIKPGVLSDEDLMADYETAAIAGFERPPGRGVKLERPLHGVRLVSRGAIRLWKAPQE